MKLHVSRNGQTLGEFDEEQLTDKLETGEITYDDMGWADGMAEWLPLRQIVVPHGGATLPPPPPPPHPGTIQSPPVPAAQDTNTATHRLKEDATVYSTPGNKSSIVAELHVGDEITVGKPIKMKNSMWDAVTLSDGRSGYISGNIKADNLTLPAASPGRKWPGRVLRTLGLLWIVVKVIQILTAGGGLGLVRELDFTNPSLFGIIGFISLIASFFVGQKRD